MEKSRFQEISILNPNCIYPLQGSSTRGIFYFTHSGTILKFLAFLDLYRDDAPLLADNYDDMKDGRKWRTSRIDAFGSNIAFVLKKCKSSDPKDGKKVIFCVVQ